MDQIIVIVTVLTLGGQVVEEKSSPFRADQGTLEDLWLSPRSRNKPQMHWLKQGTGIIEFDTFVKSGSASPARQYSRK
jgi:hypothetical protein